MPDAFWCRVPRDVVSIDGPDALSYLHSQTSQYGQEVTSRLSPEEEEAERRRLRRIIANIQDGTFARDWALEQQAGYPTWRAVRKQNMAHPLIAQEERLLRALGLLERDDH